MYQTKSSEIYDDGCRFTRMSNVEKNKANAKSFKETVFNLVFFEQTFSLLFNCKLLERRTIAVHDIYLDTANC